MTDLLDNAFRVARDSVRETYSDRSRQARKALGLVMAMVREERRLLAENAAALTDAAMIACIGLVAFTTSLSMFLHLWKATR